MKVLKALRSVIFGVFAILWTFVCFFLVTLALLFATRGRASHWVVRHVWVAVMLRFFGVRVITYARPIDVSRYTMDDRDRLMADVREVIIHNKAELDRPAEQQGVAS